MRNPASIPCIAFSIAVLGFCPAPLAAQSSTLATYPPPASRGAVPQVLSTEERAYYRALFAHLDREEWDKFNALLAERPAGLLHPVATAEYFTHARSPRISAEQIAQWLPTGLDLPQADQITRLGAKRGLTSFPELPRARDLTRQPSSPKRLRPRPVEDGTMPPEVSKAILDRIVNDDPVGARLLLDQIDPSLSPEARAEWRQRVAWSFYIENDDAGAYALALTVRDGAGAWVAEGDWVAGLAAWRLGDCTASADAFRRSADHADSAELRAAAHFWAGRALTRCRDPQGAQDHLRKAAQQLETLYGMLALEQLGQAVPTGDAPKAFSSDDWRDLGAVGNVRVAIALIEIGRIDLADEVLRHQAGIGDPRQYDAMTRLARELSLPATQLWMAHNAPRGKTPDPALRYPVANWQPTSGWRVDPALAFAHALQESNFQTAAVSPANARGLMQITPITVRQHAARLEMDASYVNLDDPQVNLAFGQRNLEMLRDSPATEGKLPKIMAAYNAGVTPVTRWNSEVRDLGDPLLYMESIPYWETRGYVAIVMRNYWMYEQQIGGGYSPSRLALAQGQWPGFPQVPNARMNRTN
ncbi:MAG: lytic murein transglycosylase [Erythrobacter sp.]|nr:lytic murein transglycosylase [Erythrobacter sp.]